MTRIDIVGGGQAGYEAALVAVELAAEVLLVERDRTGGQCVLSDCVPSRTFIATGRAMTQLAHSDPAACRPSRRPGGPPWLPCPRL